MYKVLTAVAVVAMTALSTVIIATVLLHSSISKQSGQIRALERAEHSEQKQIATLEGEVAAENKHKKLTSVQPSGTQLPRPIGQAGLASAHLAIAGRTRTAASMHPGPAMHRSDLFYSGLPWRHAP